MNKVKNNWMACAMATLLIGCASARAEETPGIAKEKPASGPFVDLGDGRFMVPYSETIPGTEVKFEMVPVPGGKFKMGSPDAEPGRADDEGPQFEVEVEAFWMGKHEVTWAEYKEFMGIYLKLKKHENEFPASLKVTEENVADAVTIPTKLYDPSKTYERGEEPQHPAVTMSPYAARHYTKWLSMQAGRFYRLPAEAEWEYAARAGTATAYSFGDDAKLVDENAWHYGNAMNADVSMETYRPVGTKTANKFGLYDMHGNVSELVLDEYVKDHYKKFAGKTVKWHETIAWPTKLYPRVHRGGSWYSEKPGLLRSAARGQTDDEEWKFEDPNTPKSPWWYTEDAAQGVGFRILRPLTEPKEKAERAKFWEEAGVETVVYDVKERLRQGRALQIPVSPALPEQIKAFKK